MRKKKYVIVSPKANRGGVIVLHALCKCLCELGYDAKMFYVLDCEYKNKYKYWFRYCKNRYCELLGILYKNFRYAYDISAKSFDELPIKGCREKILPYVGKDTVVVYPEVIYGNPLGASKTVRWFLSYNKYPREAYGINDLFVSYRDIFNDSKLNPQNRQIQIPYFDLELYKQTNFEKRKGCCYIVRKGRGRRDLPSKYDGTIIDDMPEKQKVEIFNQCEYCISYDTQTAYTKIAALCGCIPIIVPESGKHREDYRTPNDNSYGEAFGFLEEEINYAIRTRPLVESHFVEINNKSLAEAEHFAELCETFWT